ncbi:MAG: hypothetical protein H0U53_06655 [Actinobacteria bacterium]|nr:hypothetical protein [Actinomycetota bacterium]
MGSVCTLEPLIESFLAIGALLDPPQAFRNIRIVYPLFVMTNRSGLGFPLMNKFAPRFLSTDAYF